MEPHNHFLTGAAIAVASAALPDDLVSFATKILAAVIIGLVTGGASKLGSRLLDRSRK